jgi:hypothetical protein
VHSFFKAIIEAVLTSLLHTAAALSADIYKYKNNQDNEY